MAEKKITKRESFTEIAEILKDLGKERLAGVMEHELELLAKKNASGNGKPTAVQMVNNGIKEEILECMANRQDENYKKAILLYKQMINEPAAHFPELTRSQVTDWIIKRYGSKKERDALAAFHSLIINHNHRNEVLGF